MPKNGYLGSSHPSYPSRCRSAASTQDSASLGLGGFDAGFITSRARNPAPQFARSESWVSAGAQEVFSCPKERAQTSTNVLSVTFLIQNLHVSQKRSKVLFVACAMCRKHSWRIRLAAYGARLERVLG